MRNIAVHRAATGALALALLLIGSTDARAQTSLRYKFAQGDSYSYTMEQKVAMKLSALGAEQNISSSHEFTFTWKVESVDKDGTARMTQTIDRIKVAMDAPTVSLKYDTRDEKKPDDATARKVAELYDSLVGAKFETTVTPRGEIKELKLPEKIEKVMKGADGVGGVGLTRDGFKQMLEQMVPALPSVAVKLGEIWTQKQEVKAPGLGTMQSDIQYTYQGAEKKAGRELQKITTATKSAITAEPGATFKFTMKGQKQTGIIYFDAAAGRLHESRMSHHLTLEATIQGRNVTMDMQTTTGIQLSGKTKE